MKWHRKKPWVGANFKGQVKDNASSKETERKAKEIKGKPVFGIMKAKRIECASIGRE